MTRFWLSSVCFVDTKSQLCEDVEFAGHTDWRSPTKAELSQLFSSVKTQKIQLKYINASCAVSTASDGHVFTENTEMAGKVLDYTPENSGLRCVRSDK